MQPAIRTHQLCKVFGTNTAVEDLTLTVEQGEVFGFLGPNGAGKTTSVKMLLDLIRPTSGEGYLFGMPLSDTGVHARVGYLPEHFRFHDWLNARECLKIHADLYSIAGREADDRIGSLLELVGLSDHAQKQLKTYSKGMLQRFGLAQALLNEPDLVILDEPTSGLDPVGRRLVRDIISKLSTKGTTVFLNSHLLSEVEITCHRVAFIKHGRIIQVQPLHTLINMELSVKMRTRGLTPEIASGLNEWCPGFRLEAMKRNTADMVEEEKLLLLSLKEEAEIPRITRYLVEKGVDVFEIIPEELSLEELFIQIVGSDGGL